MRTQIVKRQNGLEVAALGIGYCICPTLALTAAESCRWTLTGVTEGRERPPLQYLRWLCYGQLDL
jgi:hypothetical protein